MERNNIIPFPTADAKGSDPADDRARFFADLEYAELVSTIPQADAEPGRMVY